MLQIDCNTLCPAACILELNALHSVNICIYAFSHVKVQKLLEVMQRPKQAPPALLGGLSGALSGLLQKTAFLLCALLQLSGHLRLLGLKCRSLCCRSRPSLLLLFLNRFLHTLNLACDEAAPPASSLDVPSLQR